MTQYECTLCNHRFEKTESDDENRCPSCLHKGGLREVGKGSEDTSSSSAKAKSSTAKASPTPSWLFPTIGLLLIGALGFGAYWFKFRTPTGEAARAPLTERQLAAKLEEMHIDVRPLFEFLKPTPAIENFAQAATRSANGSLGKAEAVYTALRTRADAGSFQPWSLGIARASTVGNASSVLEWTQEPDAHKELYPLEISALMVASLRALDVDARIVEIESFEGEQKPADGSGHFGYFGVAVHEGSQTKVFDPWGAHPAHSIGDKEHELSDLEVLGAAMNLRAVHFLSRESNIERALESSATALKLYPRSPSVRSVRGAILVSTGAANEAMAEFRAANELRSDGPRHNLMAGLALTQRDLQTAQREVDAALAVSPQYAGAHATQAAIYMANADPERARNELEITQRLEPAYHLLPSLWANFYAGQGDTARAMEYIQQAIELNEGDVQARMMAAQMYRQIGRYNEMRIQVREILNHVPQIRRPEMEQMLTRLLGPTAMDPPEAVVAEDAVLEDETEEEWEPSLGSANLDAPTLGGSAAGNRPSILGGTKRPSLLGGESLGAPPGGAGGGGLRLDMNN